VKPIALIGHRGVGKTSLLARIEKYFAEAGQPIQAIDLDKEIEKQTGRSVSELFKAEGEAKFRKLERATFTALANGQTSTSSSNVIVIAPTSNVPPVVLSLGAGYDVSTIPNDHHVIWVRRATDEAGRIFTDRPRLDPQLSAIEEYKSRASARESKYAARADAVLIIDEGIEDANDPAERDYFLGQLDLSGATLTLKPENFARDFTSFIAERLKWKLKWFELRDDLLTQEQMTAAIKLISPAHILLSFRSKDRIEKTKSLLQSGFATDWALELGEAPFAPTYVSKHHGTFTDLKHSSAKLKAALKTETFDDLKRGHRWQQEDPEGRVFLPMSNDGRWVWYRDHARDLSLNFIRESDGSASDQPTLLQWQRKIDPAHFAAVLGDPVKHSRTPMEHREFFAPHAVYAIRIEENEFEEAIEFLKELGLTHAAVTAPLKQKAQALAKAKEPINTLAFVPTKVEHQRHRPTLSSNVKTVLASTNTDLIGLRKAAEQLPPTKTQAVWGGGGTLPTILQVFPNAQLVSARTKLIRDTNQPALPPDLVIWAAAPKHGEQFPPKDWKPKCVFDLNYSEASPARDYAMFKAQAQAQREFWETL
jgi:shikimate kinase